MPLSFVVSFLVVLITACTGSPNPGVSPVQSPNDDRQYRLLTLENQMQVLLISDPQTPKAAASLDVNVGHAENPDDRGGLAHFLEHMLFLGTDKYPDPAEYEKFVTEHGGNRNAYTSFEHTNYFFDIDAAYLPEALDRFAQFFISPRFDEELVDKEKNAVQSEYQMGLKSDSRRGLDVLQEVMNPEHPFSRFSVGSLDTLADTPQASVRDDLLVFYDKYYSANLMRLVVLGAGSLDELESMVAPMFSPVPNKAFEHETIAAPLFTAGELPAMLQIKPQATRRLLQVMFPLDDYRDDYRVKPMSYLGNLVGHEGEGSLLSQLKAEGLAESLSAGSGLGWRGGSLFNVSVTLTEEGVENYDRVVQLLFNYLDMVREAGPKRWLYEEQSRVAELAFRFKERAEPINYVASLASSMHYYAPEDVLQGNYIMSDYQAQMLEDMFSHLEPANALVILDDQSVSTDRVSEHYGAPYSIAQVREAQLAVWQGDAGELPLALPAANEFIVDDVALVSVDKASAGNPKLVLNEPRKRIWFAQDDEYRIPKGAMYVNFRSPEVGQNAEQAAMAALYTSLLRDQVNEYTYPALLAGLNFSFYKHAQGVSLRISGYTDKQFVLLKDILADIAETGFDQQRFDNIRANFVRSLENAVAKRPSSQVFDDLRESLLHGEWGEQALIAALQSTELDTLNAYAASFWASASAEALIYGNYTDAAVDDLAGMLDMVVPSGKPPALSPLQVTKLAEGERALFPVSVEHDDAVLAWYLQGAGNSWQDRAATALTAQIMKSGFFQQLRTEQQLGYIVQAFSWSQLDVPGLVMLIQSPVADSAALAEAMEAYLGRVEGELDEEQYLRHRRVLVNEINRPQKNMWERAEFYWQSIAKKRYAFDGREQLAEAVEAMTLADWSAYYRQNFLSLSRSLQVAAPGKWGVLPTGDQQEYPSAAEIKASHNVYIIE
ncbi:peptidase M16 [Halioglobus maricola]|uniref:Protease 3 n=2 Tax=Halioglobus maricola TaxID=2601894 RepID=A0A5P9NPX1_9GAMM|nr:peptidase M16 [Halioglobus maricola]